MTDSDAPDWVQSLCRIPIDYPLPGVSLRTLFQRAAPDLDEPQFVEIVRTRLESEPALVQVWQQYSYDKRGTPSPYLDGLEVGFATYVDDKFVLRDVHTYGSPVEACAEFIWREALWVLERRRPS